MKHGETVFLNGHEMYVYVHFSDVNVLGADFLLLVKARLLILYDQRSLKITGNFKKKYCILYIIFYFFILILFRKSERKLQQSEEFI